MSETAKRGAQEPDEGRFWVLAAAIPSGVILTCAQRVVWAAPGTLHASASGDSRAMRIEPLTPA